MVYSLSAGNLIPTRQTNDYSLMLQWFIPYEVRCRQYQITTASRDMQGHIRDKSITNNSYIGAKAMEWTCTNHPLFRPHLLGLGQMGCTIYMSRVVRDTLHSLYGKTAQLQTTVYLAAIERSQIKGSVVCRNH